MNTSPISYKIWLLTAVITALLIHIHYGVFLITIFTTPSVELPINSLQELHDKKNDWTFSIEKDTVAEAAFRVSYKNMSINMFEQYSHCDIMI